MNESKPMKDIKERMISAIGATSSLALRISEFESKPDQWFEHFAQTIDDSPYGLDEWIAALAAFQEWEIQQGRILPLDQQLEYLNCCTEGISGQAVALPLPQLLKHYLMSNGVDAS
jgi:hypothetical protein